MIIMLYYSKNAYYNDGGESMDIDDIKIFIEINNFHSISAAAHALVLTQSTVSRRLLILENELNVRLFSRGKGCGLVSLTPAGERFLLLAEQIVSLADEAASLQRLDAVRHLSVGAPDSIASYMLKEFFNRLLRQKPAWDLEISIHDSLPICEMVANRTADVGLINGEAPYSELSSTLVYEEEFVVMRRGVGENRQKTVHPSELDAEHEIFQIFSPEYHRWHNFWWKPGLAKLRVNFAQFTAGFLYEDGDWAVLPESVALALLPPDGYISKFSDNPPRRRCFFVTHKKPRPGKAAAVGEFYEQLSEFIAARIPRAKSGR